MRTSRLLPFAIAGLAVVLLVGCSRVKDDWRAAQSADTNEAYQDLNNIGGIGEIVADAVVEFFAEPRNVKALGELLHEIEVIADELIQDGHTETPDLDADYALVVLGVTR